MKKQTYTTMWLFSNIILAILALRIIFKMPIYGFEMLLMLFINIYVQLKYNK
jgi:hypothetical protein